MDDSQNVGVRAISKNDVAQQRGFKDLIASEQLGYCSSETTEKLGALIVEVRRLIRGLLRSLQTQTSLETHL